ncbi:MAG: hypothetical protein QW331_03900 [Candidatus Woesearchaeota archaeon]
MANNATTFSMSLGYITLVLGVLGFVPAVASMITLEDYDNYAHLLLGVVSLGIAYKADANANVMWAKIAGAVAVVFGVYGFISPMSLGVSFTMLEDVLHLALGVWGLWAGFSK